MGEYISLVHFEAHFLHCPPAIGGYISNGEMIESHTYILDAAIGALVRYTLEYNFGLWYFKLFSVG